ncbi:MAG: hypothetical protein IJW82_06325 [Clostridia bacterium]|nr:hypothetical protein [Clostridia bacterium]
MKSRFGYIIDNIFVILVVFLVTFVWTRHFVHNIVLILVITFFVTMVSSFFILVLIDKNKESKTLKLQDEKNIKSILTSLVFMTKKQVISYIASALKNLSPQEKKDHILIINENKKYAIFPIFYARKVEVQDYVNLYKRYCKSKTNIIILAEEESGECYEIRNKLNQKFHFVSLKSFYFNYLKKMEMPLSPYKPEKRKRINDILGIFLSRKQSKKYFFLTIFFCAYSFLFRYNFYYLICGIVVGILTIISLKNKRFNKPVKSTMPLKLV